MVNEIIDRKPDYLRVLIYGFIITLCLYFGRTLFIPFSFALFLSIIIYPICKWLEKLGIIRYLAILISIIIVLVPIIGLVLLVIRQFFIFSHRWPEVQEKLLIALNDLYSFSAGFWGMPVENLKAWVKSGLSGGMANMILPFVKDTIAISSLFIVLLFIIPIYVFLILYYRNILIRFISLILPENSPGSIRLVLNETVHTYYNFVKGMSLVYLSVGLLNSVGLYFLGIPDPFFFGFITSILTIIPYVGIIAGAIVPVALAWITYDSIYYPLGVIAIFTFVQIIEANLIFPLAVGNKLELNPLVVLLVVIAGGIMWGVSGMILFIPFIGILKIIAQRIPSLQPISVLLGRDKEDRLPD